MPVLDRLAMPKALPIGIYSHSITVNASVLSTADSGFESQWEHEVNNMVSEANGKHQGCDPCLAAMPMPVRVRSFTPWVLTLPLIRVASLVGANG